MEQTTRRKPNHMANVSLILGVIAVMSILNVYYAVLLGCISILLACLSRGGSFKMPEKAIGGFAVSVFAIIISILLTAFSMYLMVKMFGVDIASDPEALQNALMELYTKLMNEAQAGGAAL